jgi:hypothetical protein
MHQCELKFTNKLFFFQSAQNFPRTVDPKNVRNMMSKIQIGVRVRIYHGILYTAKVDVKSPPEEQLLI